VSLRSCIPKPASVMQLMLNVYSTSSWSACFHTVCTPVVCSWSGDAVACLAIVVICRTALDPLNSYTYKANGARLTLFTSLTGSSLHRVMSLAGEIAAEAVLCAAGTSQSGKRAGTQHASLVIATILFMRNCDRIFEPRATPRELNGAAVQCISRGKLGGREQHSGACQFSNKKPRTLFKLRFRKRPRVRSSNQQSATVELNRRLIIIKAVEEYCKMQTMQRVDDSEGRPRPN
jgi:hypothetical protein